MVNKIYQNANLTDAIVRQNENLKNRTIPEQADRIKKGQTFKEIFDSKKVTLSKHAALRTEQRNIHLGEAEMAGLDKACKMAEAKGIKDALVIMKDSAFIINSGNRLVVTVIDKSEMEDNVFSNIDGAVFI